MTASDIAWKMFLRALESGDRIMIDAAIRLMAIAAAGPAAFEPEGLDGSRPEARKGSA